MKTLNFTKILQAFTSCSLTITAYAKMPNIVLILADDLGYGDCQTFNSESKIKTPHLNQLAEEGVIFTDAHSASATCTPSRYGLLTGINPARTGVLNTLLARGKPIIKEDEKTLADLFRSKGYSTHLVGKWHLGFYWDRKWTDQPIRGGAIDRGFDSFFGIHSSAGSDPMCFLDQDRLAGRPTEQISFTNYDIRGNKLSKKTKSAPGFSIKETSPTLVRKAIQLIEEHTTSKETKPFFLYYASPIPHQPWVPMKKFQGKSGLDNYGDFVMQMDWVVGQINQALKNAGLEQNTLLFFTSDNGVGPIAHKMMKQRGHQSSEKFRGMKAHRYEGGHRVPFIAKWPGKLKPGTTSKSTINFTDFFATFSELLGIDQKKEFPSAMDSQSFLPALMNHQKRFPRQPMVHRLNALRVDDWKWIHPERTISFEKTSFQEFELYDLQKDPGEKTNLAAENQKLAKEFFQTYQNFDQEIKLK